MLLPSVRTQAVSKLDRKELSAALKLLAGYECLRDAQQAHIMLVRLTESDHRAVAEDARSVLSEGMRKDWFGDTKPFYQDLIALASRSSRGAASDALSRISVPAGLMALVGGLVVFSYESTGEINIAMLVAAVGILVVALAAVFVLKK